jgi:hypothetical protein
MGALPAFARDNEVMTFPEWKKSLTDREARMLLEQFIADRAAENDCEAWLRDYYGGV